MTDVEIVFHGTNGWFDNDSGCTSCISIHHKNRVLLFDVGTGIRRLTRESVKGKNVIIFLSHLHLDHTVGLHFLQNYQPESIRIYVHIDLLSELKALLSGPYTKGFEDSPYSVVVEGVVPGISRHETYVFNAYDLNHSTPVLAYKVQIEHKIFSYCVDTKLCEGLRLAAEEADVFVCDCGFMFDEAIDKRVHLTPEEALSVAKESNVSRIVLTHFGCTRYNSNEDRLALLECLGADFGEVVIAVDGLRMRL